MKNNPFENLDWQKMNGLIPAIIQDADSMQVLMLAYMNQDALDQTLTSQHVTFFSRSKQRLWTKGETSGHFLKLVSIQHDCDNDTLLIQAKPQGPSCHLGTTSCFGEQQAPAFLSHLETIIAERYAHPTCT